jgi:hypothetical protein
MLELYHNWDKNATLPQREEQVKHGLAIIESHINVRMISVGTAGEITKAYEAAGCEKGDKVSF